MNCVCGSGSAYTSCCEPYHEGLELAPTPETLMRSRYGAFALKKFEYLEATSDPQTQQSFDHPANEAWALEVQFTKLEIVSSQEDGNKGFVEFKAYFSAPNGDCLHHEKSRFRKQAGEWFYREGKIIHSGPLKS